MKLASALPQCPVKMKDHHWQCRPHRPTGSPLLLSQPVPVYRGFLDGEMYVSDGPTVHAARQCIT
jgi:hypothetical protein